jgi:DNA-binding transcriptional MerR regulator
VEPMEQRAPAREAPYGERPRKMTIGAVCDMLRREFSDISISKIRYLEDQKLLSPRRTQGGYRLYSTADVARLRTILRLQRDEFLPLRVIRQELAAGRTAPAQSEEAEDDARPRRMAISSGPNERHSLDDVLEYSGADERLLRELEEYGVLARGRNGGRGFDSVEREIIRTAAELSRFGVAARNLRVLRTSADREAVLIEQILGPALRSRNRDRRREAVDNLESLAAVVSQLKHLMLVRDLRKLVQE